MPTDIITGIVNDFSTHPTGGQLWVHLRANDYHGTATCIYTDLPESNVTFEGVKVGMVDLLTKLVTVDLTDHDPDHWTVVQVVLHPDPMRYGACTQAEFSITKIKPSYEAKNMTDMKNMQPKTVVIPPFVLVALHGFLALYGAQLVSVAKSLVAAELFKLNLSSETTKSVQTVCDDVIDALALALGIPTK